MYHLSRYTSLLKNINTGETVLYNTLTKNCVSFDLDVEGLKDDDLAYLMEKAHLFTHPDNDIAFFKYFLNCAKYKNTVLSLTLSMTYQCNFKCIYCYEQHLRRDGEMTIDMNSKILGWIDIYLKNNPSITNIDICFHGGEPLICYNQIIDLAKRLKNKFEKKFIIYMHIISNGSLLKGHGREFEKCGIKQIQVTIDGFRETHDARRMYVDGTGSFDDIISNCKDILNTTKTIKLMINSVIDSRNEAEISKFKNYCDMLFNSDRVFYFFSDIALTDNQKTVKKANPNIFYKNYNSCSTFDLCTARGEHNFIIDCYGDIYKCITGVGRKEFKIGTIKDSIFKLQIEQARFLENGITNKNCINCFYYPICLSGCMFSFFLNGTKLPCRKCIFDEKIKNKVAHFLDCGVSDLVILDKRDDRNEFLKTLLQR